MADAEAAPPTPVEPTANGNGNGSGTATPRPPSTARPRPPPGGKQRPGVQKFSRKRATQAYVQKSPGNRRRNVADTQGENTAAKAGRLDGRHKFVLGRVADLLGMPSEDVEAQFLSGPGIDEMDNFFAQDGRSTLTFFADKSAPDGTYSVRFADPGTEPLKQKCVYVVRTAKRALSTSNVAPETTFGVLDAAEGRAGLLAGMESLLSTIVVPQLTVNQNWGKMDADAVVKDQFLNNVQRFQATLQQAKQAVEGNVVLKSLPEVLPQGVSPALKVDSIRTPSDYQRVASDVTCVEQLEILLRIWCRQITNFLAESERMRKEADTVGPRAELEHWKFRTAQFNGLLDQIKSEACIGVVGTLHKAKSKHLDEWRALDAAMTEGANEAKDNVKYLSTLEKFCEPLYSKGPAEAMEAVPGLINAIRMIHSVSPYYNTSERMTALFIKVTNQMITTCKRYIYEHEPRIWEQEQEELFAKVEQCKALNAQYQRSFYKEKSKLEQNPAGNQFDFSEMSIFGKVDTFCTRLDKICELVTVFNSWERLNASKLEGIKPINVQCRTLVAQLKKRPYDPLNTRTTDFDDDYDQFKVDIEDLLARLQEFCDQSFEEVPSCMHALDLLERFERVKHVGLELGPKYAAVFELFAKECEETRKVYQRDRSDPPVARNLPPMAGRIVWARQLFSRVETPMSRFQKNAPEILKRAESKKTIKTYNKIGHVLLEFELLYHRGWWRAVDQAYTGLQATLLVRHPETGEPLVNCDPHVMQLIRETKIMQRLNLDIPDQATQLCQLEDRLKAHENSLRLMVAEYGEAKALIPEDLRPLLATPLQGLEAAVEPGTVKLNWMSVTLDEYLASVNRAITALRLTAKRVNDILTVRIDAALHDVSTTLLCTLPETGPFQLQEYLDAAQNVCHGHATELERKSALTELAVSELLAALRDTYTPQQRADPATANLERELRATFAGKQLAALVKSVRLSFDAIKRALTTRSVAYGEANAPEKPPFFAADVTLDAPNVVMVPSLDELQNALNKSVTMILSVTKQITLWGKDRATATEEDSFHGPVSQHKDVVRISATLSTALNFAKSDITTALEQYNEYERLWKDDREAIMKEFLEAKPGPELLNFEAKLKEYDGLEGEIKELPDSLQVGSLQLSVEPLKVAMTGETHAWKQAYGRNLNQKAVDEMEYIFEFCAEKDKRLGKPVKNLEDVRTAMNALKDLREHDIKIDRLLGPIEQSYQLLQKCEVNVPRSETEKLDSLHFTWNNVQGQAKTVQEELIRVQPEFKTKLLDSVQKFNVDTASFVSDYNSAGPMVEGISPSDASDRVATFQIRFDDLFRKYVTYTDGEELFGLTRSEYPDLLVIKKELGLLQKLYSLYNDVVKSVNGYYEILWKEVDIEGINQQLLDFGNRCRKLPKALKEWAAFNELRKKIDDFSESCPLLEAMSNKAMIRRHWDRIADITGHEFDVESDTFLLRNIMEAPLLENKEDIEDTCIAATKELDIEAKLKAVKSEWGGHELTFSEFKTRGELLVNAGEVAELMTLMEDSLMVLGSLMSNRYNAPFKPEIQKWVRNLSDSSEIMERWLVVQNLWVYLEAVFVGGDIAKQLPKEAKRFSNIDKSWQKIMTRAHETTNLVACCVSDETMATLLPHLLEQLEVCQKSLSGYLEKKRLLFPRFFFVSDSALLEILGQASDSHTIQAHLLNIFDNIKTVTFHEKQYDQILAYSSKEGETVELTKPIMASGNVEAWLSALLKEQRESLHAVICDAAVAALDSNFQLIDFINAYTAQVGILGIQILWTRDGENALANARTDKKIMQQADDKFQDILSQLINATLQELTKRDRTRFETLVTLHVHQRDIFHELVVMKIKSPQDFEWSKQARFYFLEEERKMNIHVTDVVFKYCNEFIGCVDRLCITPLTDRCYITLAQALNMSMGGAPAGPAGTGKTETVKDMGRCLGKYVVVFNCSDQMDYRGLGRIYKGLAQAGAWGCFDEFNRIELPVLSVAAQQIAIVLNAKKERRPNFIFMDGDDVTLDPEFGLFLTMNPGYAGRQELPENLKIQFRMVAMMVPDRQIIIRVKLAACGFQNNVVLARKFYTLYKLCEEQLTKQVHYDFGLRNILSVLRTLGPEKRKNPDDGETTIVMRVLRDMNLSKLVDEDEPLFLSLISDLFPGIELETAGYPELEAAIAKNVEEAGLVNHPSWNLKLIQLFETQRVRHGFMVLGPSGAGKTCNIKMLTKSMTDTGVPHKEFRMNPKAITAPQMFGRLDVATNDWTDGIFNVLWRRTLKMKKGDKTWIVLDGPVDAVWIENLNSVLDDNKMLTLANGDRIPMSPDAKLVFEPHNIDNASPATVSRNGMVFMSSSALPWEPILEGWIKTRPAAQAETLRELFTASYLDVANFCAFSLEPRMRLLECNYIKQAIDLLQGLIPEGEGVAPPGPQHLARLYVFALMWSLGAVLELEDRTKLAAFMGKHEARLAMPALRSGSDEIAFDYVVNPDGEWAHWSTKVEAFHYPVDEVVPYRSILVPNVDNVRSDFLIDTISKQRKSVLLIGEPGTAKTVIVKGFCRKYDPDAHMFKSLNFSSTTEPNGFQRTIESYVDKRMGTTYGPPSNRRMTVFIDDVNMPIINEWGDQIANEIVRQVMGESGFFSLDKPGDFINLADMQYMAAMPHPGGGRNDIPERLKRQFSVFNCTLPQNSSIDLIFRTIGCGYFCAERGFSAEVVALVKELVPLTRTLWQQTKGRMLPTPAKFHYVFNLRDVSRIWEGMLRIAAPECPSEAVLLNLWKHEATRVLADRFTNKKDVAWFQRNIDAAVAEHLGEGQRALLEDSPFFVDFLRDAPEVTGEEDDDADLEAPKVYELSPGMDAVREKLHEYLTMYNETIRGAKMDLVFFYDCMVHIIRVSRIIRTPQGNALLVGVGGSGKQSVTRLATSVARYKPFQIQLSRSYNENNLLDDLKVLYRMAGVKGDGVTFIMTDNEIKSEGFLEYINNVLATGEIGGLFARDELDEICSELTGAMKAELPKVPPTNENLYDFFITRVRNNLHVVLCFSPVSEKFRTRALKFPAVFSGCTMDWFMSWPKDALVAVADHFLKTFDIMCTAETKAKVVETMGVVQDGVNVACSDYFQRFRRQTYVTPASYLSFLNTYRKVYDEKKAAVGNLKTRMSTGLEKLVEAAKSVDELSKELVVKERDLAVASKETEKVLLEVTQSAAAAEKVKKEVQKVKDKAQAIVDAIDKDKLVAEAKLAAAAPALAKAESALQTIKPADISTVKKLGKPPHLIMRIMDCVLLLFQRRLDPVVQDPERPCMTPSWKEALKTMNGPLLQELIAFNKDYINEETCELMAPILEMDDYSFETAKKVCGNVAGLCSWTEAMAYFYTINKEVLPLKANLLKLEKTLNVAQANLAEAQAELDAKQAELDIVQENFNKVMKKKQELQDDADTCQRKMNAASALIGGLGGERERWTKQCAEFDSQLQRLVGDVLLMCGFMSYSGPFNAEFRDQIMTAWKNHLSAEAIPYTKGLVVAEELVDNPTAGEWALQGLPTDDLSLQNGIIVTKATRYPLLIDPQGQGKAWIKNREAANELQVTTLDHKYFRTHLEDALSLGKPVLIEDVGEELDPCLDNVLEKNFIKAGSTFKVKVGDKEVDVMDGFMLYITTKLPNPSYPPEVFARTSIIDFTVTMKGLEDQLLAKVILAEKAELETERVALMTEVTANKKKMKELEDNLLNRLTNTQGSLVDDESLIEVLRVTKRTAEEVNEKLSIAADTEIKINTAREEYRPVATRGSILYFLIVELSMVNVMYQTSLDQFLGIFGLSLSKSQRSPVPAKRIRAIIDFLTFEAFKYTARGLYEVHKFLFTLLLALKIDMQRGAVKHEEFSTLIKGGAALDLNAVEPKPKAWIIDSTWLNLVQLSQLPEFADVLNQIKRGDRAWKAWFDEAAPEEAPIPDGYDRLGVFQRLLLVRSWCPDRTMAQARKYVADSLGARYAEAVILNMESMWAESSPRTPMVALLSMGSDPTAAIKELAKEHKLECSDVSMGQGQEVHARRLVSSFQQNGGWALLQNCHLALDFLPELLESVLAAEGVHEDFRLFITTEVHPRFPINLLQAAIKFTNEPPQGMKAGLKRTYQGISQDKLDVSNMPQWKPMLYGVAFLHSIVQERRKYGPLGWNIPYEFNAGDLIASVQGTQNHLDDMDIKRGVGWNCMRYMFGEVHYGGRVTDDRDKRLLNTFCTAWFGEHMFKPEFEFYKGYQIPVFKTVGEYLAHIEAMSPVDSPEVFGLHPNADITYQTNTAVLILGIILDIQPKESAGSGGETREDVVTRMCNDFLSKLPADFVPHEVRARLKKMGAFTSMNIFLRQEIDRMQRVISLVRQTLSDLVLAIDGTIIMSEDLRDALDNMYDARVPKKWAAISWLSTSLGFWFTELLDRHAQFHSWCFQGRPKCFWLTGFFNPQGFITAMRQEITRAHKGWALDSVVCANDVTKLMSRDDVTSPPKEGVYIYGLYLDGAGWSRKDGCLAEPPAKVLYTALPVIHLYAINSTSERDKRFYECPIYRKPRRTDLEFVAMVDLKTAVPPDHWTLRGVALLCDTK